MQGYKQTELGRIPKDWKICTLDQLGTFSKGKGILKEQLVPSGLPCIRYGEIYTHHHYFVKQFFSFIPETVAKESQLISKGVVLFAGSGETLEDIGKCIAYERDEIAYAGGDIIILKVNDKVHPVFLSYLLNGDIANQQRRKLGEGHSVVHLYSSDLATLKVPLPNIAEQKKAVSIFKVWDKSIATLTDLIATKQQLKKGLMQQLLTGKKRLQGFKGKWVSKKLKHLGTIVSGGTPDTKVIEYWGGEIDWITPTDITALKGYRFLNHTERRITEAGLKSSSATLIPSNSVIVCTRATIGDCAINIKPITTNQGFKSIIPQAINPFFLYYKILSIKSILIEKANGSTFLEISKTDFENIEFLIPPTKNEQEAIGSLLEKMDEGIDILLQQLEKLKEQKQGLMQQLLTGKKRVKL